jgi:hypothetical protein
MRLKLDWPTPSSVKPRFPIPGELILVIVSMLISWGGDMNSKYGLAVTGNIPSGMQRKQSMSIHVG